ncbi:glycosyltransferase family 39 protein [Chitinophaga sp. MM2321]|uniref:glycosyltransferase family 39 protein n=1 Tax=Chitinophaga sp. MM2321 TaxID=3137178 RepID=UPI0032D58674
MNLNDRRSSLILLLLFVVVKIIFQYWVISPAYDLQRDEYLHLDMANHISAGYLSVPPFTAFNSLLIKWLGNGVFWIHFFPALYGALTMVIIWKMITFIDGGWYAQVLAATLFVCSAMSRLNLLYQPNSMDVLSWTLLFWLLMLYLRQQQGKWLLWMGVVTGIGFLNKYNIIFLVIGLIGALLLSSHRKIFKDKNLYIGGLLALLIVSPNLVWQIQHGLPVIHHMKELSEYQLVNVSRLDFISDQFIFFIGGAFIIVAAFVALLFHKPYRPYRVILLTYIFVILLFTYLRAKSYYSLGLYPVLIAFGCAYWERVFAHGWTRHLRILWVAVIIVPFVFLLSAIFPVMAPEQIRERAGKFRMLGLLRWEDGKDHPLPQDFADMLGWHELAGLTLAAYQRIPEADKPYTLVICENYGEAGAVNYYNRGEMPLAVSFDADYVYWFPKLDTIRYIIKVGETPRGKPLEYIGRVQQMGALKDTLAREYGSGVYLLSDLSPQLPVLLQKMITDRQQGYRGVGK